MDRSASSGRFRILRPHTQGGLGEVYVALDEELDREVALKKIQARHADNSESRSRFLREAVITGALEHPGIVPVYGLGVSVDGRPFYAMRFIRGQSLKEAIDHFHRSGSAGWQAAARTLELRQLLGHLIDVCNAVAFAHSRGVLHRDLKPDNIMLGSYGETLVVDWGMAKAFRDDEEATHHAGLPPSPEPIPDPELTQIGRTLGTPQYMSPEQAAGFLDQLTPASDVYGLGATLYYLLTGQGPLAGVETDLIPLRVQGGDFPRPRQINPHVPAALEAICLKAMAHAPEDRYGSARLLAGDLERWLADEAVQAYAEPWLARSGRWARRHKGRVGLIAAAVALAATVTVASVLLAAADQRRVLEQQRADRMEEFATERSRLQGVAEKRRLEAEAQWKRAESSEALARRYLYFSRINLADRAWQEAHIGSMLSLLQEERAAQKDLLGFEWHYLWRLQHSSLFTLEGHSQTVRAVAFSPDGSTVASASDDRTIRIWDTKTGKRLEVLRGHSGPVNSLSFCPDGRRLASASEDQTVKVWDVAGRGKAGKARLLITFQGHHSVVNCVAFSHDGKRLASSGQDQTINIWDASGSQPGEITTPLYTLRGHNSSVNCVAFSPDGRRVGSASGDSSDVYKPGEVKVWDLTNRREILSFTEHTGRVNSLAFRADGQRLATASTDRMVKIWDVSSDRRGVAPSLLTFRGHSKSVLGVAFSADGKHLASSSEDRTIKVWDATRGVEILTLRGHTHEVFAVAFSPGGERLVSGSEDHTVRIWDALRSQETRTLEGHELDVNCVTFCPQGRLLATASDDRTLKLWDAMTGKELLTLRGHQEGVNCVAFSPDGKRLASGSQDGTIKVWDTHTGLEVLTIPKQGGFVSGVAVSPDGKHLAASYQDRTLRVWDLGTQARYDSPTLPRILKGHRTPATCITYSPDGQWLASGSEDGAVRVWDASGAVERLLLAGHTGKIYSLAFSADGRYLATASADRTVKLWNAQSGEVVHTFKGHTRMVASVVFSPDGRRLASGSDDQTVKLWDTATGEEALTLKGHRDTVTSVAFSPDGYCLASASDDWTAKIWNARPLDPEPQFAPSDLASALAGPRESDKR